MIARPSARGFEEVEEKEAAGKHSVRERRGATDSALRSSLWDVIFGMLFSNLVMYFIVLATAATLFMAGKHTIVTAAEAAHSLTPLAGRPRGFSSRSELSAWVSCRFR